METFTKLFKEFIIVVISGIFSSFAMVGIMIPNGLTYGGVTGIGRIIQQYTTLDYSLIIYGLCFLVMIIVGLTLGFKEVRKIMMMSIVSPAIIYIFEKLDLHLLQTKDLFLSAVFCGVAFGISNGIIFYAGFSSGGTDSIAKVIRKKLLPYVDLSKILFGIDFVIIVVSAFVFGTNIALYALITMFVTMKMSDAVMYGFASKIVELRIITSKPNELTDYVIHEIGRGVTGLDIIGGYTNEKRKELIVLCSPRESLLIKRFLAKEDPGSFVSLIQVNSVWGVGKGFMDITDEER